MRLLPLALLMLSACQQQIDAYDIADGIAVTWFQRSPASVNTTVAPAGVTCLFYVTSATYPLTSAGCEWVSESGAIVRSCATSYPSSGTPLSGNWTCPTEIRKGDEPGTWRLKNIWMIDSSGQRVSESAQDLAQGIPLALSAFDLGVTSGGLDHNPPSIIDVTVDTPTVYQDDGATVSCSMELFDTDDIGDGTCAVYSPTGNEHASCIATTEANGLWSCDLGFPVGAETGTWTFDKLAARDSIGNMTCVNHAGDALTVAAGSAP